MMEQGHTTGISQAQVQCYMHMQRADLRSNVPQVTLFERKLKQHQLIAGRAHTLFPHMQIARVHALPFSRITCLNSSWAGSTGKFCTLLDGDLMAFLF